MAKKSDTIYDKLYSYQTRLQGVANDLAVKLAAVISESDPAVLKFLLSELPKGEKANVKEEMKRVRKIIEGVEKIRKKSYSAAKDLIVSTSADVAKAGTDETAKEFNNMLALAERAEREKRFCKTLTKDQQKAIIDGQGIDGMTIADWFHNWTRDDLERISSAVQTASVEQLTISDIARRIRGTKENNYTDGILEVTKVSAVRLARTVVNGVSNNARVETIKANSDVIDGIKFVGTLDAKTCPYCASYDGHIWRGEDMVSARRPPIHPNCRCTLVPYVELKDDDGNIVDADAERPAANADFDKLAQDSYNAQAKEKGWSRRWDDLSASTRLKYYYQAQKDYEKRTGKPAYRQVNSNLSFPEYFKQQPDSFKRAWLGAKRYEAYKDGKLTEKAIFAPDLAYTVSPTSLVKFVEPDVPEKLNELVKEYEKKASEKVTDRTEITEKKELPQTDNTPKQDKSKEPKKQAEPEKDDEKERAEIYYVDPRTKQVIKPSQLAEILKKLNDEDASDYFYEIMRFYGDKQEEIKKTIKDLPARKEMNDRLMTLAFEYDDYYRLDRNRRKEQREAEEKEEQNKLVNETFASTFYRFAGDQQTATTAPEGSVSLEKWWEQASELERREMREKLRVGLPSDILLGKSNIVISKDGIPIRISDENLDITQWPDELWKFTGKGKLINQNSPAVIDQIFGETSIVDIAKKIAKTDWEPAIEKLPDEKKELMRLRIKEITQIAERGGDALKFGRTESSTEDVLAWSYMYSKDGLREALPQEFSVRGDVQDWKTKAGWLCEGNVKRTVGGKEYGSFNEYLADKIGEESFNFLESANKSQGSDSYLGDAVIRKIAILKTQGIDCTDPKYTNFNQYAKTLNHQGVYCGDPDSSVSHWNEWKHAFEKMRHDTETFDKIYKAVNQYDAAVQLILENVQLNNMSKESRTMVLYRTESEEVLKATPTSTKKPKVGAQTFHNTGACESHSQTICSVHGDEVTVVRVPFSRIHGVWMIENGHVTNGEYTATGDPQFAGEKEEEIIASTQGLPIVYVGKNASFIDANNMLNDWTQAHRDKKITGIYDDKD